MDLFESMIHHIDWWLYIILVCLLFAIILAINYFVKKLNEARLEQRVSRTYLKPTLRQSVQFENKEETRPSSVTPPDYDNGPKRPSTRKGISLVFDKEDNILDDKRKKEVKVSENANNTIPTNKKSESSREEYLHSVPLSERSSAQSINTTEEAKPVGEADQDLDENEANIIEMPKSKEVSESKEALFIEDVKTVNQANIDKIRKTLTMENDKIKIVKVEHNKDKTASLKSNEVENDQINIIEMPGSKEVSEIKEATQDKVKTSTQVNIDKSRKKNKMDHKKDEIAIQIDDVKVEQNKYIDEICKTCNDKTKSLKVELSKVEIDKVEQNKDLNGKAEICKTYQDNAESSKVERSKAVIVKEEQNKDIKEEAEICKTNHNNKADSSKMERGKGEIVKEEQKKDIEDAAEIYKTNQNKAESSKTERSKAEIVKEEQNKDKKDAAEICKTNGNIAEGSKTESRKGEIVKEKQNKDINDEAEICKTNRDIAESSKTESRKAEIGKVEQKKDIKEEAEICKTNRDIAESSKTESSKAEIVKVQQNKDIKDEVVAICKTCRDAICKTCRDKDKSSKTSDSG